MRSVHRARLALAKSGRGATRRRCRPPRLPCRLRGASGTRARPCALSGSEVHARGSATTGDPHAATLVLRDLRVALPRSDRGRARRGRACFWAVRRTTTTRRSPARAPATRSGSATPHICVHWVEDGPDAPRLADGNASGAPRLGRDDARRVRADLGDGDRLSSATGRRSPTRTSFENGGDGRLDIYLADVGAEGSSAGARATTRPLTRPRVSAFCVIDEDYTNRAFGIDPPLARSRRPRRTSSSTPIQFGYDWLEDLWLMEGTAAWMEDEVFDGVNDNLRYLGSTARSSRPAVPLDLGRGGYEYGAWIFWRYLSERFGPGLVKTVWNRAAERESANTYSLAATRGRWPPAVAPSATSSRASARRTGTPGARTRKAAPIPRTRSPRSRLRLGAVAPHTVSVLRISPTARSRSGPRAAARSLRHRPRRLVADVGRSDRDRTARIRGDHQAVRSVRLRRGRARVTVPFGDREVRRVELVLTNADTRFSTAGRARRCPAAGSRARRAPLRVPGPASSSSLRVRVRRGTCSSGRERLVERYEAESRAPRSGGRRALRRARPRRNRHRRDGRPLDDAARHLLAREHHARVSPSAWTSPTASPAFRAANDRTLAAAEASDGVLIPFVRLDLSAEPVDEATRCLDLGARGIKLHPRAQTLPPQRRPARAVFALAAERRVPILIHGGRGLPPIADELERLVDGKPGDAADHRPRRHRRPRRALARLRGPPGRLLRHVRLEPDRPARRLPALLSRAGALRLGLPVRPAADRAHDRAEDRAAPPASTTSSCGACSAAPRRGSPTGSRSRSSRDAERAPDDRAAGHVRADPRLPDDGDAAPLDAPGRHDRRARPRPERVPRAGRLRGRARADRRARSRARATSGRTPSSRRTRPSGLRLRRATFRLIHLARHRSGHRRPLKPAREPADGRGRVESTAAEIRKPMASVLQAVAPPPSLEPSPLGAARVRRRLTVEEVAARSGLAADDVRSLEEGRIYRFPSVSRRARGHARLRHRAGDLGARGPQARRSTRRPRLLVVPAHRRDRSAFAIAVAACSAGSSSLPQMRDASRAGGVAVHSRRGADEAAAAVGDPRGRPERNGHGRNAATSLANEIGGPLAYRMGTVGERRPARLRADARLLPAGQRGDRAAARRRAGPRDHRAPERRGPEPPARDRRLRPGRLDAGR